MKQTITLTILLVGIFFSAAGQNFKQQFEALVSKNDTIGQLELLKKWEVADINDAEMYVAYFNFYVNKSRKHNIEISTNPKGKDVLQIMETDTAKKEPVGYIYENEIYEPNALKKGFEYADKGIAKNPSRLDIRFGKIYLFGELEDWKNFTNEIIKTIDYSITINNKWTWTDNKARDNPKADMLSSIQNYQLQLYNTNNNSLLKYMKQIAEAILKNYPEHVESLSNLSIVYLINKDYDKALEALLKAEKLAPTDYIVLANIAQTYKLQSDYKNAIKYYELTIKHGDKQAKQYAKEQIEELKTK